MGGGESSRCWSQLSQSWGGRSTLSPPGQRLVESVRGQESQALGTVQVREYAWTGVTEYILADARRTAVGVGFGPDFIQDSGTAYSLEGSEYTDVRSPHNYVFGTLARLGVAGALLVLLLIGAGAVLSVRRLADSGDAVTVLAALLVLGLPVTALLGVVLESPFGAIPYFWAIGQLARTSQGVEGSTLTLSRVRAVPAVEGLDALTQRDLGLPPERVDARHVEQLAGRAVRPAGVEGQVAVEADDSAISRARSWIVMSSPTPMLIGAGSS